MSTVEEKMSRPELKRQRQAAILDIVGGDRIQTQVEVVHHLAERGIRVTQATVSRDMVELGLLKGRDGWYIRPSTLNPIPFPGDERRLQRLAADLPLQIDEAAQLIVLRTLPGYAHSLAVALDACCWEEVVGTVAGDDTVLVALKNTEARERFRDKILALRMRVQD
ncbi:MAG: arginine repressor [Chloroflexi bacterium]|nr:arginine repressor [Chloroflexota bacterium]MCL5075913.1 arginine repressor [Chloroflexota bacterium]